MSPADLGPITIAIAYADCPECARLRQRIAELEAQVASLRSLHAEACYRIAAQSELLTRRAEKGSP